MADTTLELNAGTGGTDLAGDDDATTGFHQYLKLKFGGSGTQTTVTSSVGLPVNIVQDSLAGLTVNLSATDNAVLDTIDAVLDAINAKLVSGTVIGDVNLGATDNAVLDSIAAKDFATQTTLAAINTKLASGTVIGDVNLGATDNAVLDAIAASVAGTLAVSNAGLTELAAAINSSRLDVNIAANALNSSTVQEDAAHAGTDYLTAMGAVRDDSLTTLTPIDGDYVPLRVNSTGALHVTGGGGGTEYTEDVATADPIVGSAVLIERDDALSTVTPIEGDWIGLRGTAEGALWVQDFNSDAILADTTAILADTANMDTNLATVAGAVSGTEMQVDVLTMPSVAVTNAGTFATQVDGAALTALQLIDNPVVAHDAAASGSTGVNMAGAYATNSIEGLTQVAAADAARLISDLNGVLVTRNATTLEEIITTTQSNTDGSEDAVTAFGAGGAGIHNYVTSITVTNTSATNTSVAFLDGTAGTELWRLTAPTDGGAIQYFDPPLKQTTANTGLFFDPEDAVTTLYVSINGFQAQG